MACPRLTSNQEAAQTHKLQEWEVRAMHQMVGGRGEVSVRRVGLGQITQTEGAAAPSTSDGTRDCKTASAVRVSAVLVDFCDLLFLVDRSCGLSPN